LRGKIQFDYIFTLLSSTFTTLGVQIIVKKKNFSTSPNGAKKKKVASPLPWPHKYNDHHHLAIPSRAEAANGASAK
jgi:hypothetical protein